jgi:bifunctional non-homologous end joining protein LigD
MAARSARRRCRHVLIAFDVLYVNGRDLARKPLRDRRAGLETIVDGADRVHAAQRLAANGLEAWAQVLERGYEGYVAKDDASAYEGGTMWSWRKDGAGKRAEVQQPPPGQGQ